MVDIADLSQAAALLGDPARANMLCALKEDEALSATELAHIAGVAPNTASGHLARLSEAGLVSVQASGRWRYYRLASIEVAELLEALEALAGQIAPERRASTREGSAIRYARSCYDHLAGELSISLTDSLVGQGYLEQDAGGFALREGGRIALEDLGVDFEILKQTRRPLLRRCPDWSQGASHMGGALAAMLFELFLRRGWVRRARGSRAVELTRRGRAAFSEHFGLET